MRGVSFPVLNSGAVIVEKDGTPTKEFINYLSVLQITLNNILSNNGIKPPMINATTQTNLEANGKNILQSMVFNETTNKYQLLTETAGTYSFKDILVGP